ncbi:hypothetical protein FI667_g17121, partial [Globisporangium splendens]
MESTPEDLGDAETQRYVFVASPLESASSQTTEVLETPLETPLQTPLQTPQQTLPQSPLLPLAQDSQQSPSSPFLSPSPPSMGLPEFVSPTPTPSPTPSPSPPPSEPVDPSQSPMSSAVQPVVSVSGRGEGRTAERAIVAEGLGGACDSFQRSSPPTGSIRGVSSEGVIVAGWPSGASDPFREEIKHTNPIWLDDYLPNTAGWKVEGIEVCLYATDKLTILNTCYVDLLDRNMREKFSFDRSLFYIDIFFRWRFFRRGVRPRVHPDDLTISWSAFVIQFSRDPSAWIENRYLREYEKFMNRSTLGPIMAVHEESMKIGQRCAVPPELKCSFCYKGTAHMPQHTRSAILARVVSSDFATVEAPLRQAIERLDECVASTSAGSAHASQASQVSTSTEFAELRRENEELQRRLATIAQTAAKRRRP